MYGVRSVNRYPVASAAGRQHGDGVESVVKDLLEQFQSLSGEFALRGLDGLLDATFEGIVVCDAAGRVLAANASAARMLGLDRTVALGARLLDRGHVAVDASGATTTCDALPMVVAIREAVPVKGAIFGIRFPDGDTIWLRANVMPIRGDGGTVLASIANLADVSDLKRTEIALAASQAHSQMLAQALEQSDLAVVITDIDGCIEYVNPKCCQSYGYAANELIGQYPRIFKSAETSDDEYRSLWRTILDGKVWRGELSNRTRDGRILREKVAISPVRGEDGSLCRFIAVKEGITQWRDEERRRHELFERMARLERMELVATLASGIAHDFNNVLVAILGYSELARNSLQSDGGLLRVAEYVDEITLAGERARELVQQLLNFSRADVAKPCPTRVGDVARDVASLLRATLPERVSLIAEIDEELPTLAIDPSHLNQVLMNLLVNARDAVAGVGTITLSAGMERIAGGVRCDSCKRPISGDFLRITVSDDGAGIAPEARARMFEPFFTTKAVGHGTGIGLPVVHGMTHLSEGHVLVESTLGAGTRISVLLPVPSLSV